MASEDAEEKSEEEATVTDAVASLRLEMSSKMNTIQEQFRDFETRLKDLETRKKFNFERAVSNTFRVLFVLIPIAAAGLLLYFMVIRK